MGCYNNLSGHCNKWAKQLMCKLEHGSRAYTACNIITGLDQIGKEWQESTYVDNSSFKTHFFVFFFFFCKLFL